MRRLKVVCGRVALGAVSLAVLMLVAGCSRSSTNDSAQKAEPGRTVGSAGSGPAGQQRGQVGPGRHQEKQPTLAELTADPRSCVAAFLEAIRQGDDQQILQLYTAKAREEASALGEHFAPRGSDTAKFEVGQVEYLDENSARVKAIWTDLDESGKPQSDEALWMVRKEPGGWRVAAMAVKVFEGDEYLFLDFEDLNRTKSMLEEFRKEQLRRAAEVASRPEDLPERR